MKSTKSSIETEITSLDPIRVMIRSLARQIVEKVRKDLEKQIDSIIQSRINFSDIEDRKSLLKSEIDRLTVVSIQETDKIKSLQKEMSYIESELKKIKNLMDQGNSSRCEEIRSLVGRYGRLAKEVESLKQSLNSFGRLGVAHINVHISSLKKSLEKLSSCSSTTFLHMEENKSRFLSIYDDADEYYNVAKNIESAIMSLSTCFIHRIGRIDRDEYFERVLSSMTADDIEYRPFESINRNERCFHDNSYDMDELESSTLQKGLYKVVQDKVMKFARIPRDEMIDKINLFSSFSEYPDGYIDKLTA